MATSRFIAPQVCQHISPKQTTLAGKVRSANIRLLQRGKAQYMCLQCGGYGKLSEVEKHLSKTKHEFAVSRTCIYCAKCKDVVLDHVSPSNTKKRKLSQVSDTDDSYLTSNASQKPCGREGVRGLFNMGETCYMNAVLQMMVHNPLLSSYFLGSGHPIRSCPISRQPDKKTESDSDSEEESEQKACVACAMNDVFAQAKMSDEPIPACAVNLLFASWKAIPYMAGRSQQDAQEWFMQVVDKLHETVKPSLDQKGRCHCFFHRVFFGRLRSEVSCDRCGATSTTHEPYSSISLDFKKQVKKKKKSLPADVKIAVPNVQECLRTYTSPETLSADNYRCQSCAAPRQASKRLRIRKLPAILCVHVKRFGVNVVNGQYAQEKYAGKIEFPLTLDMTPFTTKAKSNDQHKFLYELECVVVHQGDQISNGHYFAFCKQDGKWFRFDDEIVTATTTEDVLGQEAYLLFYSLKDVGNSGQ